MEKKIQFFQINNSKDRPTMMKLFQKNGSRLSKSKNGRLASNISQKFSKKKSPITSTTPTTLKSNIRTKKEDLSRMRSPITSQKKIPRDREHTLSPPLKIIIQHQNSPTKVKRASTNSSSHTRKRTLSGANFNASSNKKPLSYINSLNFQLSSPILISKTKFEDKKYFLEYEQEDQEEQILNHPKNGVKISRKVTSKTKKLYDDIFEVQVIPKNGTPQFKEENVNKTTKKMKNHPKNIKSNKRGCRGRKSKPNKIDSDSSIDLLRQLNSENLVKKKDIKKSKTKRTKNKINFLEENRNLDHSPHKNTPLKENNPKKRRKRTKSSINRIRRFKSLDAGSKNVNIDLESSTHPPHTPYKKKQSQKSKKRRKIRSKLNSLGQMRLSKYQ